MAANFTEAAIKKFQDLTKNPEIFLTTDPELSIRLKQNLKELYDYSKSEEFDAKKSNALPELIIKNMDLEQIWQQLELRNEEVLTRSVVNVSKLLVRKDKLIFKNLENKIRNNSLRQEEENHSESEEFELDEKGKSSSSDSEESYNEHSSSDENQEPSSQKPIRPSKVDDDFFKLSEMEKFLNAEEKKLNDPDSGNDSESDSKSEGSIDFFEGEDSDCENETARLAKFKDYFVEKNEDPSKKKSHKRNKFLQELSDDEQCDENQKSTLELRQERLKRKISELEEKAVDDKPWMLKGEIQAEGRPQNSLLEEFVEFDLSSRPAPVITEHINKQIEDIVKQRIKDKSFDSVKRKIRPVDTPLEYKKRLVLDQEKSKHSLAHIYEKEFLEQKESLDPENADKEAEEPELHKEVRKSLRELFAKLDALSNFHFTPKPAIPELKITRYVPAINMEEVAPISSSDAALLAPEEVRGKPKGDILGKGDKTKTDKKRERRKKKRKQKLHLLEKEKQDKLKSEVNVGVPKKYKDNRKNKNNKNVSSKNVKK